MQCPNCGETSRIREKDNFCHKCGYNLKQKESRLSKMKSDLLEVINAPRTPLILKIDGKAIYERDAEKQGKFKILSTGETTYLELCGKSMGTGVVSVNYEHIAGDDILLNLKLSLRDFEFLPDGYFDEVLKKLGGEPPESKRLK